MTLQLSAIQYLNNKTVILASASPRRKQILTQLGLKFHVIPSTFLELLDKSSFATPSDYVVATAIEKTKEVVIKQATPPDLVIGADTIVVSSNNKILEKPSSTQDAIDTLKRLRDESNHHVLTAIVLAYPNKNKSSEIVYKTFVESTTVTFGRHLQDEVIYSYVETGDPMDKAGSYGYQSLAGILVKSIQGCYYNVVGFPLYRFYSTVAQLVKDGAI